MNIWLVSMPDSFQRMSPVAIRMQNDRFAMWQRFWLRSGSRELSFYDAPH
jgi:hypothetical protein